MPSRDEEGAKMVHARAPWAGAKMNEAMDALHAAARRAGWGGMRLPAWGAQITEMHAAAKVLVPLELVGFMGSLDPQAWRWVVNPQGMQRAAASLEQSLNMSFFEAPAADVAGRDPITVRPPWDLRFVADDDGGELDAKKPSHRPRAIKAVHFADSASGHAIVYWVGGGERGIGSVWAEPAAGGSKAVWLGGSLASWVARLAACDGVDLALASPEECGRVKVEMREAWVRYLAARRGNGRGGTDLAAADGT